MALFQVGAPVEVEFNGKWFPATVNKEVDSGFRVQFDSDHSSTVIPMEEVPTRVRGRNLPVSAMEDSVMALSTTASQEPDSLTSAIPERKFPSTILSKKTSSASATVQENTSTASIVPHLEALVSALQARAPSKAKTTLGIHLADSISDDDNDDDEEIDGPDDDGDNGPSGGDESSSSSSAVQLLTNIELNKLQLDVTVYSQRESRSLTKVPLPLLKTILRHLDRHVVDGLAIKLVQKAFDTFASVGSAGLDKWIRNGEGRGLLQVMHNAIKAAVTTLRFLNTHGIDRTVLAEERIDNCCNLLKSILQGMLVKVLSLKPGITRGGKGGAADKGKTKRGRPPKAQKTTRLLDDGRADDDGDEEDEDEEEFDISDGNEEDEGAIDREDGAGKGRKKGQTVELPSRESAKSLTKAVFALCVGDDLLPFMELLEMLVGRVKLDDRLLLALTSTCLSTLPIQCDVADIPRLAPLRHTSLSLLQSLFALYEHHRFPIMDDLFGIVLRLPTGKKQLRTHKLHHFSKVLSAAVAGGTSAHENDSPQDSIQSMSALLMLLIQSCVCNADMKAATTGTAAAAGGSAALPKTGSPPRAARGRSRGGGTSSLSALPPPPASPTSPSLARSLSVDSTSPMHKAYRAATYFVRHLLARCQKKEEGPEYREFFKNFVDDLLASILLPDWPGSETLLQVICSVLTTDLAKHGNIQRGGLFDDERTSDLRGSGGNAYLSVAIDMLGRICSRLRSFVRHDRKFPMILPEAIKVFDEGATPLDEGQVIGCTCGIPVDQGGFMLDCDRCHRWFHAPCVGVKEDFPPHDWFCDDCRITNLIREQREVLARKRLMNGEVNNGIYSKGGGSSCGASNMLDSDSDEEDLLPLALSSPTKQMSPKGRASKRKYIKNGNTSPSKCSEMKEDPFEEEEQNTEAEIDDKDIFRQLLLNYLSERAQTESWLNVARQYHIAHWLHSYENSGGSSGGTINQSICDHFRDQWSLAPAMARREAWEDMSLFRLDTMTTARVVRNLVVKGSFVGKFDALLVTMLELMGCEVSSLRARIIKAVNSIVAADPMLMANENIRKAITSRFHDEAISVRQSAVDLVGRYALLSEEYLEKYYEPLCERLLDRGVSVRKSVVKILRDALTIHPNYARRSEICELLVHRASHPKEEDSIKDLVQRTFEEIWFEVESSHSIVTPSTGKKSAKKKRTGRGNVVSSSSSSSSSPMRKSNRNPRTPTRNTIGYTAEEDDEEAYGDDEDDEDHENEDAEDDSGITVRAPPGWSTEKAAAGLTFISPSGKRCLSAREAFETAKNEEAALNRGVGIAKVSADGAASSSTGGARVLDGDSIGEDTPQARVKSAAAQIVEVVHSMRNRDWLVELLRDMLFGAGKGTKNRREAKRNREDVRHRCETLVGCCVEFLLLLEEDVEKLPFRVSSVNLANGQSNDQVTRGADELVATLSTLHVFCRASPTLLSSHFETLLPYLKAANHVPNSTEAYICEIVAQICSKTLPLVDRTRQDKVLLRGAAEDLKRLTYKFGKPTVHAAVECLAVLSTHSGMRSVSSCTSSTSSLDPECIEIDLARQFYKVLRDRVGKTDFQGKDLAFVQRGLTVLGAICRYHRSQSSSASDLANQDWMSQKESSSNAAGTLVNMFPADISEANICEACYRIFCTYLSKEKHDGVVRQALAALAALIIGTPRLMLVSDRDGIVESVLKHRSSLVRLEAVLSWRAILEAEEHRVESGIARQQLDEKLGVRTKLKDDNGGDEYCDEEDDEEEDNEFAGMIAIKRKVTGDQDGESSVVGGILQMHIDTILELIFETSEHGAHIRAATTTLLGVMLRQGLVNPMHVLPYVIALLGSMEVETRNEALQLVYTEDEKHSDFLKIRLLEGMCISFEFQRRIYGKAAALLKDDEVLATLDSSNDASHAGEVGEIRKHSSIFAGVYTQCIREDRKKRHGILKSLLGLFDAKRATDVSGWLCTLKEKKEMALEKASQITSFRAANQRKRIHSSNEDDGTTAHFLNLEFLSFISATLCYLPYDVQEEPLFIIHHISRFVSYEGSALVEHFRSLLAACNFEVVESDEDEINSDIEDEKPLRLSPGKKFKKDVESSASPSAIMASMGIESYNIKLRELRRACVNSVAVCMLLRIKYYLKNVYRLADSKCQEYNPSDSKKASERTLFKPDHMPQLQLPNILALKDIDDLTDVLIQAQFSDFKRLMRQDPADYKLPTNATKPNKRRPYKSESKKKAKPKKKARNNINGDGDDDDDDDSDYGG